MIRVYYLNFLKEMFFKNAERMGMLSNFMFYQDNAPKQTAQLVQLRYYATAQKYSSHLPNHLILM